MTPNEKHALTAELGSIIERILSLQKRSVDTSNLERRRNEVRELLGWKPGTDEELKAKVTKALSG